MSGNGFDMKCPDCGDTSSISVTFEGWCRLEPTGTEDVGDHEWDDDSRCECGECGHEGLVRDFQIGETRRAAQIDIVAEELLQWVQDCLEGEPALDDERAEIGRELVARVDPIDQASAL